MPPAELMQAAERRRFDTIFSTMDEASDGRLDLAQLKAGYSLHFGQVMSDEEIGQIFSLAE